MRGGSAGSSGFGGMMSGMRGLTAGSMHSPTVDNLTDEGVVGAAYDHKVVMRLATYLGEAKGDAIRAVASVLVYTAASGQHPAVPVVWHQLGRQRERRVEAAPAGHRLPYRGAHLLRGKTTSSPYTCPKWGRASFTRFAPRCSTNSSAYRHLSSTAHRWGESCPEVRATCCNFRRASSCLC